jgi:hypothetical protein
MRPAYPSRAAACSGVGLVVVAAVVAAVALVDLVVVVRRKARGAG